MKKSQYAKNDRYTEFILLRNLFIGGFVFLNPVNAGYTSAINKKPVISNWIFQKLFPTSKIGYGKKVAWLVYIFHLLS